MRLRALPIAMTALAAAISLGSAGVEAQAAQKVRFAYCIQIHMANMMLVEEYAKECGVEVEAIPLRRYADLQLALTNNEVDMAALGYVNVGLMEEAKFDDYKVIAGVFMGGQGLVTHKESGIESWSDLEGKTIGTAPNSYAELLFKTTAILNGVDMGQVETMSFATGGPPAIMALRSKEIDGFVMWEPTNADAILDGAGEYSVLDIGDNPTRHVNGVLTTRASFAENNEEAVACVVKAAVEATEALNADEERYRQVAKYGTSASDEIVETAIPSGQLDYNLYQKEAKALLAMLAEANITASDTSTTVDRVFDYSYLMAATGKDRHELGGE